MLTLLLDSIARYCVSLDAEKHWCLGHTFRSL